MHWVAIVTLYSMLLVHIVTLQANSMTRKLPMWTIAGTLVNACLLTACGDATKLPISANIGPEPNLPPPVSTLIPCHDLGGCRHPQCEPNYLAA